MPLDGITAVMALVHGIGSLDVVDEVTLSRIIRCSVTRDAGCRFTWGRGELRKCADRGCRINGLL